MLTRAQGQTLTENVIDQLLSSIRAGTWKPGEYLPSEKALREELGVSRACMREALQALASLGVIEVRSGRGARVKFMTAESLFDPAGVAGLLDPEELIHLWQVRVAIEVAAVRLAAELISDEEIAQLDGILQVMSDRVEREDLSGYIESDLALHRSLIQATGNSVFGQVYEVIRRAVRLSVRATGGTPGGMHRGMAGHRAVFEAVKARDPEGAASAMRRHLGGPNTYRDALAGLPAAYLDQEVLS